MQKGETAVYGLVTIAMTLYKFALICVQFYVALYRKKLNLSVNADQS